MKNFFKGKKTYIIGIALLINEGLHKAGTIPTELYEIIRNVLGAGGVITIAAKMNRVETKVSMIFLALMLFPALAHAQTSTAIYEYDALPAEVATYTQVIKVDNTTITTPPVCVAAPTNKTSCSVPIGTLSSGTHTISIAATKNAMTSTLSVSGLNPNNAPKSPVNLQINITVNVTIP